MRERERESRKSVLAAHDDDDKDEDDFYQVIVIYFRQWSGRPGFNPRSHHTKDFKKWYLISCLTLSNI